MTSDLLQVNQSEDLIQAEGKKVERALAPELMNKDA